MVRVVSWNVLADAYLRHEYYPHTPPEVLDRARRRKAVVARLASFTDADVLCLQEVDAALFAAAEEELGDATGRLFRKRGKGEGCAIFVRRAVAAEPTWRELVFSDKSGHVALGVTFDDVTIVTTHLKWEPAGTAADAHRGRVQLAEILEAWPAGSRVVCGDLNAEPDSDVVALALAGGLKDAYASLPNAYTCNANGQKKRIDFIFHTTDFNATPSPVASVNDDTPLPSETEPSDHVAIQVHLET